MARLSEDEGKNCRNFDPVKTNNPINSGAKFFQFRRQRNDLFHEARFCYNHCSPSNHFGYLLLCERLNIPVICEKPIVTQKRS